MWRNAGGLYLAVTRPGNHSAPPPTQTDCPEGGRGEEEGRGREGGREGGEREGRKEGEGRRCEGVNFLRYSSLVEL